MRNARKTGDRSTYTYPRHNLFFAIMPPLPIAKEVSDLFDNLGMPLSVCEKKTSVSRLHLTLLSIYAAHYLPERVTQRALLTGSAIRFVEFDIVLDRVLTFRNRRVKQPLVLAANTETSLSANKLAEQIRQTFSILSGICLPRTGRITPHITLAWDSLLVPEQSVPPTTLPVREIALVHSHVGESRYDILGRWKLVPG